MRRPIRITQSDGEKRFIGYIEHGAFVTYRTESKHLYRGGLDSIASAKKAGTASWGIDSIVCDNLLDMGIDNVIIVSDKAKYVVAMKEFKENEEAYVVHHKPHRAQYFLPLKHFFCDKRTEEDKEHVKVYKAYAKENK